MDARAPQAGLTTIVMGTNRISSDSLQSRSLRLAKLRKRYENVLDRILARFPVDAQNLASLKSGKCRIIMVLGSPRGGTSLCKAKIAAEFGLASLPGEHRLFFTLLGRTFPDHGGSSETGATGFLSEEERDFVLKGIGTDITGPRTDNPTEDEISRYAHAWAMRLVLQWVEVSFDIDAVIALIEREVRAWCDAGSDDQDGLSVAVLRALAGTYRQIDLWLYDLNPELLDAAFSQRPPPDAPPSDLIAEISPFVVPALRRLEPLGDRPLILKASSDPYRLPELIHCFESFDTDYVHVVRNPLASVNGLLDGWRHSGFWQHQLSSFYESPPVRHDLNGWKFDAFDGWDACPQDVSLIDLCVQQWAVPHAKILEHCEVSLRIRFEDLMDPVHGAKIRCQLETELRLRPATKQPEPLPLINATRPPKPTRWRSRAHELLPILETQTVRDLCQRLGYDTAAYQGWT